MSTMMHKPTNLRYREVSRLSAYAVVFDCTCSVTDDETFGETPTHCQNRAAEICWGHGDTLTQRVTGRI